MFNKEQTLISIAFQARQGCEATAFLAAVRLARALVSTGSTTEALLRALTPTMTMLGIIFPLLSIATRLVLKVEAN